MDNNQETPVKKKKKPSSNCVQKRGPEAVLGYHVHRKDGKLRRSVWMIVTRWSFEMFARPAEAKAKWRKLNAKGWQAKPEKA